MRRKLVATLIAYLLAVPALTVPLMPAVAGGNPTPPPLMPLGVLPEGTGILRRRPRTAVPTRWTRLVRRLRDCLPIRPAGVNVRPRLPIRDSLARGPPGGSPGDCPAPAPAAT